jgi:DNA-binding Lrp family transcriptional regulator
MPNQTNRKNKVVLADYNYRREIESRLLMANLTACEIEILREILDNSLIIPLKQFADSLNVPVSNVMSVIDKLSPTKLIKIEGNNAILDKEMRKHFEFLILKFDDQFEPGMEFLQYHLQKIPVHILQTWYSIPRTSDDIFQAIIEKFLITPKIYERYFQEVKFEQPELNHIIKKVFSSPDYIINAQELMLEYRLDHEKFQECMLILEYNFLCCLHYRKVDNKWEEIVRPFFEWHEYLRFRRDTNPQSIKDVKNIQRRHPEDFGFVQDMSKVLATSQSQPPFIELFEGGLKLAENEMGKLFPFSFTPLYFKNLIDKLLMNRLAEIRDHRLFALESAENWLKKSDVNKALTMSRHPIQVEKNLKRVIDYEWIYVEDFLKGFTGAIGSKEFVSLRNKGKKWRYALPTYSRQELEVIETTLCERLFEAGIVAVGTHLGKRCICVTSYGQVALED